MRTVNLVEAQTHLSRLLPSEEVAQGGEVTMAKAGQPVTKLVPAVSSKGKRTPGLLKDQLRIADDFDAPLPKEVLKAAAGN
ncbi:MAG: type II toxin-antitoxin system Phd/YefM family antitoxin [Clostridia bacterium]